MMSSDDLRAPEPARLSPPEGGPHAAPPVIVVQYRFRLFPIMLLPPLFILLCAGAIVYFRIQAADWPGLWALRFGPQAAAAPALKPDPSSDSNTDTLRVVMVPPPQAAPSKTAGGAAEKQEEPTGTNAETKTQPDAGAHPDDGRVIKPADVESAEAPPPRKHARTPVGFDPPGTARGAAGSKPLGDPAGQAMPTDKVTTEEVWNDILREADRTKAERAKIDGMKENWLVQDRLEADRRQADQVTQAINKAEADRPRFRADLQRVLTRWGDQSAPEINKLIDRYDSKPPRAIEEHAQFLIKQSTGRNSRQERVNLLRSAGLPETWVLDFLCNLEKKNLRARNGPRNPDDVLVRAARALLSIPLPPPRPAPPPPASVPTATVAPLPPTPQPPAQTSRRRSP
jgi:hypothetical protein